MIVNGLELTLRRINQIESTFDNLFDKDSKKAEFDNVLKNKIGEQPLQELKNKFKISKSNIEALLEKYSDKYKLDENLVKSIAKTESNFNPSAVSKAGAVGVMQLMPFTAKSLGVSNSFNPEQNINGGTKYLKNLLNKYNGNEKFALAAYNAGPGAVNKYGGVPPYKETQNYIQKIFQFKKQYESLE